MSTMTAREALEKAALICEERADDDCAFAIRALAAQQPLEPEAGAECNVPEGYTYGECYGRPARAQSSDAPVSEPAQCRVEGSSVMMGWTNAASPTEKHGEAPTPRTDQVHYGCALYERDVERYRDMAQHARQLERELEALKGKIAIRAANCILNSDMPCEALTAAQSASAPREWHDRLGAMIDQVGHPDYSLREMVGGLRKLRDDMLAVVDGGAKREGQYG